MLPIYGQDCCQAAVYMSKLSLWALLLGSKAVRHCLVGFLSDLEDLRAGTPGLVFTQKPKQCLTIMYHQYTAQGWSGDIIVPTVNSRFKSLFTLGLTDIDRQTQRATTVTLPRLRNIYLQHTEVSKLYLCNNYQELYVESQPTQMRVDLT